MIDHNCCLIQEVVKGYKLLFIHIRVLLEQSKHQGEMSEASTTQFQNLFICHPRKADVGNWLCAFAHHFLCASITSTRENLKMKCENREPSEEAATLVSSIAQETLSSFAED